MQYSLNQESPAFRHGECQVLKHTAMPAILTEVGFISNEKEERLINDNIKAIAGAIVKGVLDYQRM